MYGIEDIQQAAREDRIQWSGHILTRMQQRGIMVIDILNCISNGEIIEYYEDDYPHPSCLILGSSKGNTLLHLVCALENKYLWMITAYYPAPSEWEDNFKVRRR